MTTAGLSPNSVRINTATMGKAMRLAVEDEHVSRNVVSLARRPKIEGVRDVKYLTPDQCRKVLDLAPEDTYHGDAVALSLWLGLRRGEALGISWEAINFEASTVTVGAMLVRTPDGVELKRHVKGGRSKVRTVPLPRGAADVLDRRKRKQAEDRLAAGEAWRGHARNVGPRVHRWTWRPDPAGQLRAGREAHHAAGRAGGPPSCVAPLHGHAAGLRRRPDEGGPNDPRSLVDHDDSGPVHPRHGRGHDGSSGSTGRGAGSSSRRFRSGRRVRALRRAPGRGSSVVAWAPKSLASRCLAVVSGSIRC